LGLSSTSASGVFGGCVLALPCLISSAWGWYNLVFAPRLTLDEEGLRLTTYGLWRDQLSLPWSEIAHLRLAATRTRLGNELSLKITLRPDGVYGGSSRPHRDLDLALGIASFRRVDRALSQYCPRHYTSTHH
jgi:hypothetical protein